MHNERADALITALREIRDELRKIASARSSELAHEQSETPKSSLPALLPTDQMVMIAGDPYGSQYMADRLGGVCGPVALVDGRGKMAAPYFAAIGAAPFGDDAIDARHKIVQAWRDDANGCRFFLIAEHHYSAVGFDALVVTSTAGGRVAWSLHRHSGDSATRLVLESSGIL